MAERKIKVNLPGTGPVEATLVQIIESVDRWTEVKLDDGSLLRIKPVVVSVARIDGKYDPEGNPLYVLQANQVMTAICPEHLLQSAISKDPKVQ